MRVACPLKSFDSHFKISMIDHVMVELQPIKGHNLAVLVFGPLNALFFGSPFPANFHRQILYATLLFTISSVSGGKLKVVNKDTVHPHLSCNFMNAVTTATP